MVKKIIQLSLVFCFTSLPLFAQETSSRLLSKAIDNTNASEVRVLLRAGADPNAAANGNGIDREPMMVRACIRGDLRIIKLLLENGGNPEIKSVTGQLGDTLIMIAMNKGRGDVIDLLIAFGANPEGFTFLMTACMQRDSEKTEGLLKAGVDVNAKNKYGFSALDYALTSSEYVKLLLRYGATHSFTQLELACVTGDLENAKKLLAKLPKKAASGKLIKELHLAIKANNLGIVELLLEWRADTGLDAPKFRTALGLAADLGRCEIVERHLKTGVDPDQVSEGIFTPLMLADMKGHQRCVRLLMDYAKNKRLRPMGYE